ncbi:hypothetical protein LOK49_LG07G01774 [Camellia lanceoleosa]|uniref:Uncharacterized protein n=1 Tax=Camellia lanceoleosa TaxID=1840588 RepID=A0ACC0H5U5_9ERIC|nr:hypothetical protein LOK49_LG07G01774 [Camellia lanceoleosa]
MMAETPMPVVEEKENHDLNPSLSASMSTSSSDVSVDFDLPIKVHDVTDESSSAITDSLNLPHHPDTGILVRANTIWV